MKRRLMMIALAAGAAISVFNFSNAAEVPEADRLQIITKLTTKLIGRQHYRRQPVDTAMSGKIFDAYFKELDPNRMYFTKSDIRAFEPQRNLLAQALNDGNSDFAFAVYDVYRKRLGEFFAFADEMLKHPVDFTIDEEFTPDRRKMEYPADEKELQNLWRQKIKNDLLYFRLLQRALDEDTKKPAKDGKEEKDEKAAELAQIRKLWESKTPEAKLQKRMRDLQNFYTQREKIDILSLYLGAVTAVYGPHSGYLQPKLDEDFEINMRLSLTGIGATLTSDNGYIRIVDIVPGGPAAVDGRLHPEDRIIAVTQDKGEPVDVIDMSVDNAVKLIRGPEGTKVTLTVLPGKKGRNAAPENVTITRAKVILKDSEAQSEIREVTLSNKKNVKVGIISLPSFYMDFAAAFRGDPNFKSCTRDVKAILDKFREEKVDSVIMDLRGNGGGSLPEAITLTGLFIKSGPVVQVRQGDRSTEVEQDEDGGASSWDGPLTILVNKMSASAAEIFAGAMKDYRRGLIVGDSRTFGKGTVLNMIQLERMLSFINRKFPAGTLRLETAMFFRVNGNSVQQLGVEPDIQLPSLTEQLEVGELFSDYHLPWDSIEAQDYRLYDKTLPEQVPALKKKSNDRIAANPEYIKLQKRIARMKELMAKKTISLNESKRWSEYLAEKDLSDLEENADRAEPTKKSKADDPVLNETAQIAADYWDLSQK